MARLPSFGLDQTNLAVADYEGEAPGICGGEILDACSKATGLVRSEGFELSLAGEIVRGWQILGGYTRFKREYRNSEDNAYSGKTPEQQHNSSTPSGVSSPRSRRANKPPP